MKSAKPFVKNLFRAVIAFLAGSLLTGLLSLFFGSNLFVGFFGGGIAGYVLGSFFANKDYKKLKEIYDELGIDHYDAVPDGDTLTPNIKSAKPELKNLFRAFITFLAGNLLTGLLSLFFGSNLFVGFFGGGIAGYIFGNYFSKRDYGKLKRVYNELEIDHYDVIPDKFLSLPLLIMFIVLGFILLFSIDHFQNPQKKRERFIELSHYDTGIIEAPLSGSEQTKTLRFKSVLWLKRENVEDGFTSKEISKKYSRDLNNQIQRTVIKANPAFKELFPSPSNGPSVIGKLKKEIYKNVNDFLEDRGFPPQSINHIDTEILSPKPPKYYAMSLWDHLKLRPRKYTGICNQFYASSGGTFRRGEKLPLIGSSSRGGCEELCVRWHGYKMWVDKKHVKIVMEEQTF